jgi:hypothetical protein
MPSPICQAPAAWPRIEDRTPRRAVRGTLRGSPGARGMVPGLRRGRAGPGRRSSAHGLLGARGRRRPGRPAGPQAPCGPYRIDLAGGAVRRGGGGRGPRGRLVAPCDLDEGLGEGREGSPRTVVARAGDGPTAARGPRSLAATRGWYGREAAAPGDHGRCRVGGEPLVEVGLERLRPGLPVAVGGPRKLHPQIGLLTLRFGSPPTPRLPGPESVSGAWPPRRPTSGIEIEAYGLGVHPERVALAIIAPVDQTGAALGRRRNAMR